MASSTITATGVCKGTITTAAEYAVFLGEASLSNADQAQQALEMASDYIRTESGREFVLAVNALTIVEMFNGNGRKLYFPRQGPVISVTSIEYYDYGLEAWTELDTDLNNPITDGNKILYRELVPFHEGINNWRVTYTFGFSSIPDDIKYAANLKAKEMADIAGEESIIHQSDGEQAFTYLRPRKTNKMVDDIIQNYVRYHGNHG